MSQRALPRLKERDFRGQPDRIVFYWRSQISPGYAGEHAEGSAAGKDAKTANRIAAANIGPGEANAVRRVERRVVDDR